jgi:hypothetical protein
VDRRFAAVLTATPNDPDQAARAPRRRPHHFRPAFQLGQI